MTARSGVPVSQGSAEEAEEEAGRSAGKKSGKKGAPSTHPPTLSHAPYPDMSANDFGPGSQHIARAWRSTGEGQLSIAKEGGGGGGE